MDTATENNNNGKRVRTAHEKSSTSRSLTNTAIDCAKFTASVAIASLPNAIKPLAEHYFTKFIALKVELHKLAASKARLANDDFIPTSARIKFQLVASERVKEQAPAALTTLIEDSEYILAVFKADIKKRVIRLLDLEIKVADEALQLCFCTAVAALGVATSIHVFNCDNRLAKNLVTATIEDHQELLQHTGISAAPNTDRSTAQELFGILKTVTNDGAAEHVVGTLDPASKILVAPAIPDFKSTLEALFLRSWDQYLVKKAETARQICVQEFVQEQLVENITADVAMDLEGITQNSQKLDEYISSKITAGTKKLQAKVDRLSEKANSNNSKNKHGAQKSSASVKRNPRDQKTQSTITKMKKKAASKAATAAALPAAAAAKDSTNANDKNRRTGKSNRGKSTPNSNRKQTQRS